MNRKVLYLPLVIFLVLVAALMWQLLRNSDGDDPTALESALVGKPLPAFHLTSLEKPDVMLDASSIINGKPVLLNVWATWCPTCRAEHQYLRSLAAQGIRIVGINYKDDRQKALDWLQELGNPYAQGCLMVTVCWDWISVSTVRRKPFLSTAKALFATAMQAI